MTEYTMSIALVDFLPVIFTLIGMIFVVRMVTQLNEGHRMLALVGVILIVLGGGSKATWKLIMAASNNTTDIVIMADALFWLLGAGFTCLAWAIWSGVRAIREKTYPTPIWLVPVIIVAIFYAIAGFLFVTQDGRTWNLVLLMLVTLTSTAALIMLIIFSIREKMPAMALLFGINLVLTFVLSGMARIEEQTIALQWMEESTNAVAWLLFAIAAWRVYEHVRSVYGVDAEPVSSAVTEAATA